MAASPIVGRAGGMRVRAINGHDQLHLPGSGGDFVLVGPAALYFSDFIVFCVCQQSLVFPRIISVCICRCGGLADRLELPSDVAILFVASGRSVRALTGGLCDMPRRSGPAAPTAGATDEILPLHLFWRCNRRSVCEL